MKRQHFQPMAKAKKTTGSRSTRAKGQVKSNKLLGAATPINPCIPVPSPQRIKTTLFPNGVLPAKALPNSWNAKMILTPFGGGSQSNGPVSDQLVIGDIWYESPSSNEQYLRGRLHLLEDLKYFDFFFRTANGVTQWWWLVSDPANPKGNPTASFGPFNSTAMVPAPNFLVLNQFVHAGSWKIHNILHDTFSAHNGDQQAGTWFYFDNASGNLGRLMNVDSSNDFGIAVLGAFYFAEVSSFQAGVSGGLKNIYNSLPQGNTITGPSPMRTQTDLLTAMSTPPSGAKQVTCTISQIQSVIPGIASAPSGIVPPAWTNQVNSDCYMIGQDLFPYYCQLWYDWNFGVQVTVFTFQDNSGAYTIRQDERLPKGKVGPSINYSWGGSSWAPTCSSANGSFVPMPAPDFVKIAGGKCRAIIKGHPIFDSITIWSVQLGDNTSWSDFWYWFDDRQQGVIFSLAPANSLTIIDYQTFVQNGGIKKCVFDDPSESIPACPQNEMALKKQIKRKFVPK